MKVRFQSADNTADFIETVGIGAGIDTGDKGPGKAMSYAFKYAMLKALCLETGEDPDFDQESVRATDEEIRLSTILTPMERQELDADAVIASIRADGDNSIRQLLEAVVGQAGPNAPILRGRVAALARSVGLSLREEWK